jgi:hypothetical protein
MPLTEVSDLRPGHRAIEPTQAASHVLLANPNGHQCPPLAQVDPCLEAMPDRQAGDRQATAIVEQQISVLQAPVPGPRKAQVPPECARGATGDERPAHARPLSHDGLEGKDAGFPCASEDTEIALSLGAGRLCPAEAKGTEDASGDNGTKRRPAGADAGQRPREGVEPIGVHAKSPTGIVPWVVTPHDAGDQRARLFVEIRISWTALTRTCAVQPSAA